MSLQLKFPVVIINIFVILSEYQILLRSPIIHDCRNGRITIKIKDGEKKCIIIQVTPFS